MGDGHGNNLQKALLLSRNHTITTGCGRPGYWCRWPDLNRHSLRYCPLKTACLPDSTTSASGNRGDIIYLSLRARKAGRNPHRREYHHASRAGRYPAAGTRRYPPGLPLITRLNLTAAMCSRHQALSARVATARPRCRQPVPARPRASCAGGLLPVLWRLPPQGNWRI